MSTPGNLPAAPTIPLSDDLRAAYVDLRNKLDTEYENNSDGTAQAALQPARLNVRNVLDKDDECRFAQDTALFSALLAQISSTTDALKILQTQIKATASHFQTAADILGAVDKVLGLLGAL